MNSILNKEPVKRAEKALKEFDDNLYIECLYLYQELYEHRIRKNKTSI